LSSCSFASKKSAGIIYSSVRLLKWKRHYIRLNIVNKFNILIFETTVISEVVSKMAERCVSTADDHTSGADCKNFEHGVVSSDAVYVPHSKQSYRGQRGRGRSPGNYRQGRQPPGGLDRSEYDGSKQSGAGSKYGGGRGQKVFRQRGQYYARRNGRSAAYERNSASFNNSASNFYPGSNVDDRSASFGTSADADNNVHHTYSDKAEFNTPFHMRGRVRNSRVTRNDQRYEERGQKQNVQSSRGGWNGYRRGRGSTAASNYSNDDRFGLSDIRDVSVRSSNGSEAVSEFEAFGEADLREVTEFSNSDRKKFTSKTRMSSNERLIPKDSKYSVNRTVVVDHSSHCVPDEQQFRDLRLSTDVTYLPNDVLSKGNSRTIIDAKIKNTDPEFENQRGSLLVFLIVLRVFVRDLTHFVHYVQFRPSCVHCYTSQEHRQSMKSLWIASVFICLFY